MLDALDEAKKAKAKREVPIGAVVVKNGEIIGRGHNLTESLKDPTAHAEIIAIREAAAFTGGWRLTGCHMYVTVEPCAMCAGALVWSRMEKLTIGTTDPKSGACGSIFNIVSCNKLNHEIETETGVMQQECESIMKNFFKELREKKSEEIQL